MRGVVGSSPHSAGKSAIQLLIVCVGKRRLCGGARCVTPPKGGGVVGPATTTAAPAPPGPPHPTRYRPASGHTCYRAAPLTLPRSADQHAERCTHVCGVWRSAFDDRAQTRAQVRTSPDPFHSRRKLNMITAMLNGAVLGQPEPINKYDFKTLPFVPYGDAHTRHHGGDFPEVFGQIEGTVENGFARTRPARHELVPTLRVSRCALAVLLAAHTAQAHQVRFHVREDRPALRRPILD